VKGAQAVVQEEVGREKRRGRPCGVSHHNVITGGAIWSGPAGGEEKKTTPWGRIEANRGHLSSDAASVVKGFDRELKAQGT